MKLGRRTFVFLISGLFFLVLLYLFKPGKKLSDKSILGIENNPGTRSVGEALMKGGHTLAREARSEIGRLQLMSEGQVLQRVRQDFRETKTTELDGWVLSKTEALACLFYFSISQNNR